jgi:Transcriptional regulator, AbiEi antitoxin
MGRERVEIEGKQRKPLLRGHQADVVQRARRTLELRAHPTGGPDPKELAAEVARNQHGLITRAQALGLGLSASAIGRNVRSRRWERLRSGVYCFAGAPKTRHRDVLEACYAAGPDAVASFFTAGELHRLHEVWPQTKVHVTLPHALRRSPRDVKVHRSRQLAASDIALADGIPVTSAARALIDLSPTLPKPKLELAAMDAARRKRLDTQAFRKRVLGRCGLGRKGGMRKLRAIVRGPAYGAFHESVHEARILQVVLAAGLPRPLTGVDLFTPTERLGEADMFFAAARVALECDGEVAHGTDSAKARDEEKERRFARAGIVTVRARWDDAGARREEFLARLARALESGARKFARRPLSADGIEIQPVRRP